MENLKPCPLCGGKAINRVVEKTTVSVYYGIVCVKCNCRIAGYLDFNKAIKAWNRRAYDPDKVVEQLEERTTFLKECTKYGNKDAEQQEKSYATMMMYEVASLVDDLLEIVKGGGV